MYDDWIVGNVGFLASYNGRWFDGGYAQSGYEKTKTGERYRDYYNESKKNIEKQIPNLLDVRFGECDYREIRMTHNTMVYCDPPYKNTKQYSNSKKFNHEEYWDIVRKWSEGSFVISSELTAPEDFVCIWEKSVSRSIKSKDKSRATEKLFTYKYGKYAEYAGL